jgi:hypothetical protein
VEWTVYEKCHYAEALNPLFWKTNTTNASRKHKTTFWTIRCILTTYISGMQPRPIWIETCRILPLFTHFHASTVSHFSFLGRLALSVSIMRTASASDAFSPDAIQFEEDKASSLNGGSCFKLSLCTSVKMSLMMMIWSMGGWTGTNARYPHQPRDYRHQ